MKRYKTLLGVVCVLFNVSISPTLSQENFNPGYSFFFSTMASDLPDFTIAMFNTASEFENLSRLNIQLKLNNDELQFITTKDKRFISDFEVSLFLMSKSQNSSEVDSTKWLGSVLADNFKETISSKIIHSASGFIEAPPFEYLFRIGLKDMETGRTAFREGEVKLRDFSGSEFEVSDIWFIDPIVAGYDSSNVKTNKSEKLAYFEIYNSTDSIKINRKILDNNHQVKNYATEWIESKGGKTPYYFEIPEHLASARSTGIKLTVTCNNDSVLLQQPLFYNSEKALPEFKDLQDAIEKLNYLAKTEELKKLKKSKGEEQHNLFHDFWKARDPSDGTEKNEYLDEYYTRISRADLLFKEKKIKGWKTRMGRVLVMLGTPDWVHETQRSLLSYEIGIIRVDWYYYDLNIQVIFVKAYGSYEIANLEDVYEFLNGEMYFSDIKANTQPEISQISNLTRY